MPVLYNTNFLVGLNNQLYDLGNILYNYSSNTVQFSAAGTTYATASINYDRPTMILETDITATIDGSPVNGDQVLTFGPAVQPKTVILGSGTNGFANTTNNVVINPLGTSNVLSNTANSIFWDGIKWFGIVTSTPVTTYKNAISYDGNYIQFLNQTMLTSGWAWKAYYNGSIYLVIYGGTGANTGNKIAYSYDGINWTAIAGVVATSLYALTWNGLVWVVGGSGTNTIAYSYDGITWVGLGTIASATTFYSIIWMGDKWIAFGAAATGILAYTTVANASTGWTTGSISSIFSTQAYTLCWNGQILYGGGSGTNTIAYSYNGINWTANGSAVITTGGTSQTSWNGKYFLASGTGVNTLAYSQNGINFVGLGTPINAYYVNEFNARRPHRITFQRNLTISGGSGTVNTLAYSLDGINWNGLGRTVFSSVGHGSSYNGRIWVMGGQPTTPGTGNTLAFSQNGISWTGLGTSIFSQYCYNTLWVPYLSLFVAAGYDGVVNGNTLAYSYDGMTWIPSPSKPFYNTGWALACSSNIILAGGQNNNGTGNTCAYSTDGINWTGIGAVTVAGGGGIEGIGYNGTMWVAVGYNPSVTSGKIAYSYNGISWTDTGYTFSLSGSTVSWNGTLWLATGTNGIAYSYNGINWSSAANNPFTTNVFYSTWNGTVWVAGGAGTNSLAYSYNGINWTGVTGTSIFSSYCRGLGSNYQVPPKPFIQHPTLAFGSFSSSSINSSIAYSSDGITWTGVGNSIFSSAARRGFWNGKLWVVGGNGGNTLAYSYDGFNWVGLGTTIFTTQSYSVCNNGSIWVAVGQGTNTIAYSTNGITWTAVPNSS
jgi:hypothetical protein